MSSSAAHDRDPWQEQAALASQIGGKNIAACAAMEIGDPGATCAVMDLLTEPDRPFAEEWALADRPLGC